MPDPIMVIIFLRGGADALNLVSPSADANYLAARPADLRVARDGDDAGLRLGDSLADVDFRLSPRARGLHDLYKAGDLSIVHATGLTDVTRSHFDAEARMERAAGSATSGGWVTRWLEAAAPQGQMPALAVGTGLPDSLRGSSAAVGEELAEMILASGHWLAPALRQRLAAGFGDHDRIGATVENMLALSTMLEGRASADGALEYRADVDYPDTRLSYPLRTVAHAIKSDLGLRVATVDYGGWDTHVDQRGEFDGLTDGLSRALMAFWRDLGRHQQDVSVIVMSEFGRRLRSNASGGTDHGRAGAMFILGPQSKGGRLLGNWPGLENDALEEGADLAVTTDYRDVLAEVLTGHMGQGEISAVFPGLDRTPVGVFS